MNNKHVNVMARGVLVSPAPLRAPPRENSIAIKGCIDPSNQIKITVKRTTSSLSIMNLAKGSAKMVMIIPKKVIEIIDNRMAPHPARFA